MAYTQKYNRLNCVYEILLTSTTVIDECPQSIAQGQKDMKGMLHQTLM
jgi:hypothetical protein